MADGTFVRPWPLESRGLLASFQGLGAGTDAAAVSPDGSVVVGNLSTGIHPVYGPFYWTQQSGVVFLRDSSRNVYQGIATAVSRNGSVIVGDPYLGHGQAFRWANGVAAPIPQLATTTTTDDSSASSISDDGSIIAGDLLSSLSSFNPSGYTLTGTTLALIPPPSLNLPAMGLTPGGTTISANGAVVAGNLGGSLGASTPYQWNNGTLIQMPGGPGQHSSATAVSPDGSVVVGWTGDNNNGHSSPFEWTEGVVTILALPAGYDKPGPNNSATGVSTNGSTIVGHMAKTFSDQYAFIWTQANGIQDLLEVLTADGLGAQLTGWTLTDATAITPDGKKLVGNGIDPQGQQEGWIANLSTTGPPPPTQQTPTITWANPEDIVYGATLSVAQLDATASVNNGTLLPGTYQYTPGPGTLLHAGAGQSLSVTFTPTDTTNYTTATQTVRIDVLRATPTMIWANPADIVFGTPLGTAQLDATASYTLGGVGVGVPGTFTYSPPVGTVLTVGNNQVLSATFTPTDTTDYTGAMARVTINVETGPTAGAYDTRTVLRARPRRARLGRPVTLTAIIRNRRHGGGTPTGEVVFQEGTTILGTEVVNYGRARLTTSSLLPGRDRIHAYYVGTPPFSSSAATIIVRIRAPRARIRLSCRPQSLPTLHLIRLMSRRIHEHKPVDFEEGPRASSAFMDWRRPS